MKKFIAALLSTCVIATPTMAFDYSVLDGMSADELTELITEVESRLETLTTPQSVSTGSQLSDTGDVFEFTVTDARCVDTVNYYKGNVAAGDGNVFLFVDLQAKNISDEDDYVNWFSFESYVDDISVDIFEDFIYLSDIKIMSDDVRSGKILRGTLVYEIPADWQVMEICYDEAYGMKKKPTIIFTPNDFNIN